MSRAQILALIAFAAAPLAAQNGSAHQPPKPPKSLRLYVFDCGVLRPKDAAMFNFKKEEIAVLDMSVPCFLVAHPKGTLMWDVGVIPDTDFKADGAPVTQGMSTVTKPLKPQLAAVGYEPEDITYIAFSHYHSDHTANANDFAASTWLVSQAEHDAMFAEKPARIMQPDSFSALKNSKTVILKQPEYDVFGDGKVIIKAAPGHTPGHTVLFLKLNKSGPILIGGDLYHLPEERTMHRFPTFEYDKTQSAASRAMIEEFLKKTGAQLWIEHDLATFEKLKKAPEFYE